MADQPKLTIEIKTEKTFEVSDGTPNGESMTSGNMSTQTWVLTKQQEKNLRTVLDRRAQEREGSNQGSL